MSDLSDKIKGALEGIPPELLVKNNPNRFHPMANMFPLLEGKELDTLAESIKAIGLLEPIVRYEGMILDGRNRYLACKRAGYEFKEGDFIELFDNVDPFLYVVSKNIERRHLNQEQKREIIKALLAKYPDYSSRWIAEQAKVSHHTVEGVRKEQETGQSAQSNGAKEETGQSAQSRQSKDGKRRPATNHSKPKANADTPEARRKQVGEFCFVWGTFNVWQKRYFCKTYMPELEGIIDEIKEWQETGEPAPNSKDVHSDGGATSPQGTI